MMRVSLATAGLLAALALAGGAAAATLTLQQTQLTGPLEGYGATYSPDFTPRFQWLNVGDTLDWTLNMPAGEKMSLFGLRDFDLYFGAVTFFGPLGVTSTSSISFLDFTGNVILPGASSTWTNNVAQGVYMTNSPIGDDVALSAFHALIRIDSIVATNSNTSLSGALFTQPYVTFVIADRVVQPSDWDVIHVPEPATWAKTILGFGAVSAALRRRRATATMSSLGA